MKVNVIGDSETIIAGGTIKGMELEGPLRLNLEGTEDNEAVTKEYVDSLSGDIEASNVTRGTMPFARFPEMDGELTKEEGSSDIVLNNSGVVAGNYPKVTVTPKGIITEGEELEATDIPNFGWEKVSERPVTLAGYGIEDGVRKDDGVVLGNLKTVSHPSRGDDAVTVGYLDMKINDDIRELNPGDIIEYMGDTTPYGMLQCNGGILSKEMYPELYAAIGDRFNVGTIPGAGKPWKQQYDINSVGDSLGAWTTDTSLPGPLGASQAVVTSNRVYLLGGVSSGGTYVSTVYTTPINEDGTLGTWTTDTSLPGILGASQAVVTSNRVYLLGGRSGSNYVSTVYTAPIDSEGVIGTWTTDTSLPGPLGFSQAIVTSNRVYLLGGVSSGTYVSTVYTTPINEDGTLGTWTTDTSLPGPLGHSQAVVTSNRVYLLGGVSSSSTYVSTVYTAPINEDGTLGTWTTDTSLPGILVVSQAVVTSNRVYLLGGVSSSSSTYVSTVYTTPINEDGTLGTWTTATSLPGVLGYSQAIVTSNRVYLLGGHSGSTYVSTVYTTTLSGGSNDYSEYYDGSIPALYEPNKFQLPNIKFNNQPKVNAFIKY